MTIRYILLVVAGLLFVLALAMTYDSFTYFNRAGNGNIDTVLQQSANAELAVARGIHALLALITALAVGRLALAVGEDNRIVDEHEELGARGEWPL